ncbi:MAG TPA: class I SAM-dependent methyltransferase [Rhabdochlamydiaceae bacterium]|nr:class I SAM-dependent methyltransferase [Rhabdochlamydiaceae bacterium]
MKYELLDSGNQNKLEKFGDYTLIRPCSQAVWKPVLDAKAWKEADGVFTREPHNKWVAQPPLPSEWNIELEGVKFKLMPTDFGHVGIFPEHAQLWRWMKGKIDKKTSILNLFAYTGGASLYAAKLGAEVCHVDASKTTVAWARENAALNNIATVRWIIDDVIKFLRRELKRGSRYDGIILDPPTFGRGSQGEVFKIEKDLPVILDLCFQLLSDDPRFVMLSCHTLGLTPLVLHHLLSQAREGKIEMGEMVIPGPLDLTSGSYARWYF